MADKPEGQTGIPEDADLKDQTPKDDTVPKDKPKDQVPEIPKEYEGKTPEDLIKEILASQKELGKQSKEVGELRNSLAYEQQLRELAMQRSREAGTQITPTPEQQVDWNYEKPVESVEQIIKKTLDEREKKRQQGDLKRVQDEAKSYYAEGRRSSMVQNPTLFKGVEREVENAVYNSYMTGIIGIHELRNPEAWSMAAKLIHLRDGNVDRLQPANIKPVESTSTELPNPAKPGSADKPFTGLDYTDEGVQKMTKQYGLTKEEAEKIIKEEQERIAGGGK